MNGQQQRTAREAAVYQLATQETASGQHAAPQLYSLAAQQTLQPTTAPHLYELRKGGAVWPRLPLRALDCVLAAVKAVSYAEHLGEVALPQQPNLLEVLPA